MEAKGSDIMLGTMTIITLPPDLEKRLAEEARRRGISLEQLALNSLRELFVPAANGGADGSETLWDYLSGYVGTVSGTAEPLSENCGQHFADGLLEKQRQGHL
jgi:hypothetical protein